MRDMPNVERYPRKGVSRTSPYAERKRSACEGFTLVEVVIVLVISIILAAIAIPAYNNYIDRSRENLSIKNIRLMEFAIKEFELENMRLPNDLNELGPISFLDSNGKTITQSYPFLDPWGNAYRYLNLTTDSPPAYPNARRDAGNKPLSLDYDLYSMGANGVTAKPVSSTEGGDDIVRADSGRYIGLGANY